MSSEPHASRSKREVKRWTVPRPGPDGEPLGVLRIEVVPASSYDALKRNHENLEQAYDRLLKAIGDIAVKAARHG